MILEELERRMSELRREQLAEKDPRKKAMIRGEKQYIQSKIDEIKGTHKLRFSV